MLARHAENMFWAGRYVERAEDTARMLGATLQSSVSASPAQATAHFETLLRTLRHDLPGEPLGAPTVIRFLVADEDQPGSIVSSIGSARENLGALRDQIPSELWERTNRLHLRLRDRGFRDEIQRDTFAALDAVRDSCQTLWGIVSTAMAHDEGYRFLVLGQCLERALMTCRLLNVRFPEQSGSSYEEMALTLRSASGLEAYQRAHHSSADPADLVHFLLVSEAFPRSVLWCLRRAENQLVSLTPGEHAPPRRHMGQLRSQLEYADVDEMVADLHATLDDVEERIRRAADSVGGWYFRNAQELDIHAQLLAPGGDS